MKYRNGQLNLYNGDCLEEMKKIPTGSIDMVLCDLPYGMTDFTWDKVLDFEKLWKEWNRVVKYGGVIALFAQEPFASKMRVSNLGQWKYDWIWKKPNGTNPLNAKRAPLRDYEIVCVFGNVNRTQTKPVTEYHELDGIRNYLDTERAKSGLTRKQIDELLENTMASHYFTKGKQWAFISERDYNKLQEATDCFQKPYSELLDEYKSLDISFAYSSVEIPYYPQMQPGKPYRSKLAKPRFTNNGQREVSDEVRVNEGWRYPRSIIEFPMTPANIRIHPSQKPPELLRFLVKTYTKEGETVLDSTMGSGSTGIACLETGRNFVGIEMDPDYFNSAKEWLVNYQSEPA